MISRIRPCMVLLAATAAVAPQAKAYVVYTVDNPASNFKLFTYHSPSFITTDTTVPVANLTFAAPQNTITSVEFIPSSSAPAHVGLPEVEVFQSGGGADQTFSGNQLRWYPQATFTQYGVTPGVVGSFGYPASELIVQAPEPSTIGVILAGLCGVLAFRGRASRS